MRNRITAAAATTLAIALIAGPASAAGKSYTLAQVKTHKKASNCWSVVNGGVYNLTKWVTRHPGGSSVIIGLCGRDGSAAFTAKHGSDGGPKALLASYKVGTLKK